MAGFVFLLIVLTTLASILVLGFRFITRPLYTVNWLRNQIRGLDQLWRKPTQLGQPPLLPGAVVGRDDLELLRQLFVAPSPRKGRIKVDAPSPSLKVRVLSLISIFSLLFTSFSPLISSTYAASSGSPFLKEAAEFAKTPAALNDTAPGANATSSLTWTKPVPASALSPAFAPPLRPSAALTTSFQHPIAAWPADNQWINYSYENLPPEDQRIQDPSNGGTSPQNYVNVSSSCNSTNPDQQLPSIGYLYDDTTGIFYFRWRVEQIANNYATGPSAGSYASTDPWSSALWTVFFDIDGDGWRDFAVHIDGSSGTPGNPLDEIRIIYGTDNSQSLDYINNPSVHLLSVQNTAIYTTTNNRILNFHNTNSPDANWPNGASETVWDYGSTRSTAIS